ncbi:MAG: sodium:proton antiporter NhaD [Gammaproteobacteria bacterium]|jgi:NhaD family Na+/H+ antiporter
MRPPTRAIFPQLFKILILLIPLGLAPELACASSSEQNLRLTTSIIGYLAIAFFVLAYLLVMAEEFTQLRKSKPVILAAGIIWGMIAFAYAQENIAQEVAQAVRHNVLEYAELMLFLLVAMTYINVMQERRVFDALRAWLVSKRFSYRKLFWLTGALAFFISPVADNLTTALLMCAVVMAVGVDKPRFVSLSCINIVVAANAGGAFSPFGDITTLMVWQKGMVEFHNFFLLFLPAVVNFVVPAALMDFAIPKESPSAATETVTMRRGARRVMILFLVTIITAVCFHNFLHLPPMLGMMTGLAYLQFFGFYLKKSFAIQNAVVGGRQDKNSDEEYNSIYQHPDHNYDIFQNVARAEWDTLLFFYGVVLCVGGLGFIGYLEMASQVMYVQWGATTANITVGIFSAIVDNIPVMFAVLQMRPDMPLGEWLLVTLTAGVGGSLLSIGSAAGVALMGQAKGIYTFFRHLKWTPAIALGYALSILCHMWVNASTF